MKTKIMNSPKYTVAVCNYNMADTLEQSLRSILDQLEGDERFEVLVIDDGSTDGSQEILNKLEQEYEIFRWKEGSNKNLAEARNQSFVEANGSHILESLDTDDCYKPIIKDYCNIYEILRTQREENFFLSSPGIGIAPRELLLDYRYRSLGYGEDKDFWRRLIADDKMIYLETENVCETIGYDYELLDRLKLAYEVTKVNFRSGIEFKSFLRYKYHNIQYKDDFFKLIISPLAYIDALIEGTYDAPEGYEKMGNMLEEAEAQKTCIRELEEKYEVNILGKLSEKGEKILSVKEK